MIQIKFLLKLFILNFLLSAFFLPSIVSADFVEGGACPNRKTQEENLIKVNNPNITITSASCKKNTDCTENCTPFVSEQECGAELVCCICYSNPEKTRTGETSAGQAANGGGLVSFEKRGYEDPMSGASLPNIVGNIIARVLPVIGALFLVMFIYGGFLWMTAGGDETKVKKARQTLVNTTIGMGIVIGAYAIVSNILTIFNPG